MTKSKNHRHSLAPAQDLFPLVAALGVTLLLCACSPQQTVRQGDARQMQAETDSSYVQAGALLKSLNCTLPTGERTFHPLKNIAATDKETLQLAREYVELRRRETHGTWKTAAQYFNQDQDQWQQWVSKMSLLKQQLTGNMQAYLDNTYRQDDPLEVYAKNLAEQYQFACQSWRQANHELVGKDISLHLLRKQRPQPWLSPQRQLTCSVSPQHHCYED